MLRMTIPTFITTLRLLAVPVVMIGMIRDHLTPSWWTVSVFILAAGTDWLDGYLARRWDQVSELGKFLDPLVDKLLVIGPLLVFVELQRLPAWPIFIIISRDLIISGWRVNQTTVSGANRWGKFKTLSQLIAIGCLLSPAQFIEAYPATGFLRFSLWLGGVLFWVSVVLTVISGLIYLWPNWTGQASGQSADD
jgi:CDP-diacylglycerol--glycerol-3-phosphate 3-phosphatidyltransferase